MARLVNVTSLTHVEFVVDDAMSGPKLLASDFLNLLQLVLVAITERLVAVLAYLCSPFFVKA